MLISKAYAAVTAAAPENLNLPAAPTPMESFMWNMVLIGTLVFLFYVLMVRPQQRRFQEHSQMLNKLEKGDKVITGGGLVGVIERIDEEKEEVVVDLGNGIKVTALRHMLQGKDSPLLRRNPANDLKKGGKADDKKK